MPVIRKRDKLVMSGTISMVLLTFAYDVVFPQSMSDTSYTVRFGIPPSGITIGSISNVTVDGFRVNVAITLAGLLDWVAVETLN